MYIVSVPNRGSTPAILLRESFREDGKVRNRTLANLTHWPSDTVEAFRAILKGGKVIGGLDDLFDHKEDYHHGHVQAVLTAMKRLDFANLISSRPSRERDLVLAMVAQRILDPDSKLAMTRSWGVTTLPQELGFGSATDDELYAAMDWLYERQDRIEKKLAKRHLREGGLALCDLTSSYVEGSHCPLALRGHNRDGKKGKLQINWSLLTDDRGCPVATTVYPGNTSDATVILRELTTLQDSFGISHLALVGDRGMIGQKHIDDLKGIEGVGWLTAMKASQIQALVRDGQVQLGLFDERNLFEIAHPDYPGERLIACRNPVLGRLRAHKRQDLIRATAAELDKVRAQVMAGKLREGKEIGLRVGKVVNKFKVAKHFDLDMGDCKFEYAVSEDRVAAEAALDGIYVVRTSLSEDFLGAEDAVRSYKFLARVERAFRSLKTIDLKVRPIGHWTEDRVRSHIFLCVLAFYVEWHMIEAWRKILFVDEDQEAKKTRDPVAPAKRSEKALEKVYSRELEDGGVTHSFQTLLKDLSGIVRTIFRTKAGAGPATTLTMTTTLNPERKRALDLLESITP